MPPATDANPPSHEQPSRGCFSTIVIGVDGGPGGRDALALARRLASPASTTTIIAVSAAIVPSHPAEGVNRDYEREPHQAAEDRLADALANEPGVLGEVLIARTPAAALHAAAERHGADLIVIGCCRRGPLGRIFSGDDTRATLLQAPCAVAVAPREYALDSRRIATIGVGWDGGPQAERALEVAQTIARELGAEVHALAVSTGPPGSSARSSATSMDSATAEVELGVRRVDALEGVPTTEAEPGAPRVAAPEGVHATEVTNVAAEGLAQLAAEVDLLVVGSRRRGVVARLILGSTAEQLLRLSVRPLLIVPRVRERSARSVV